MHVKTIILAVLLGLAFGTWTLCSSSANSPKSAGNCLPHCVPMSGQLEAWKKNQSVGNTQRQIRSKFGAPDGVFKEPYRLISNSDETWVYHGTGTLFNRSGQHIFVFAKGNCVAASDIFIYERF